MFSTLDPASGYLYVEAAGIGAVLSRCDDDGKEHVVAYASRLLSKSKQNYCVTRRKLLAMVTFLSYFRPYLFDRKFTLRDDDGALAWLLNFKDSFGQLACFLEKIQEFVFNIVHRKGRLHSNANALSRLPCSQSGRVESESETSSANVLNLANHPTDSLYQKQFQEMNISHII